MQVSNLGGGGRGIREELREEVGMQVSNLGGGRGIREELREEVGM